MKRILLASVAALGLAGTASAADLAVRAPLAPVPLFTWTGCYLGVNGGWIGGHNETTTSRTVYGFPGVTPAFGDPNRVVGSNAVPEIISGDGLFPGQATPTTRAAPLSANNLVTSSQTPNQSSGTAGGQFGCQYQWGWFVMGGEWDAQYSGLKNSSIFSYPAVTDPNTGFTFAPRQELVHTQLDWFSTARVRLGAAWWDRVLLYATGGVAFGAVDSYTQIAFNQITPTGVAANPFFVPQYFGAYRQNRIGWTAGGGIEWAFANNWTAKAEFLYVDLGTFDYLSPRVTFGNTTGGVTDGRTWNTHVKAEEYVARVGINYLFHLGGAAPVVARY